MKYYTQSVPTIVLIKQTQGNDVVLNLLMLKATMTVEGASTPSNWVCLFPMVINLSVKPGNAFEADRVFAVDLISALEKCGEFPLGSGFVSIPNIKVVHVCDEMNMSKLLH